MQTLSIGRNSYFLTFINDYLRMCWVFFIKQKDESFQFFKDLKNLVENKSGGRIKCLRTDIEGDFCANEFLQFCRDWGIKRQMTVAYTPQQNGVAKRKNRTLVEMVRRMLKIKKVDKLLLG